MSKNSAQARRAKSRTRELPEPVKRRHWSFREAPPQRPDFYRVPQPKSGGDPYFHFSRAHYYAGEKRGYWKLVRIIEPGKSRGVTLVDYNEVAAFIAKQREAQ